MATIITTSALTITVGDPGRITVLEFAEVGCLPVGERLAFMAAGDSAAEALGAGSTEVADSMAAAVSAEVTAVKAKSNCSS